MTDQIIHLDGIQGEEQRIARANGHVDETAPHRGGGHLNHSSASTGTGLRYAGAPSAGAPLKPPVGLAQFMSMRKEHTAPRTNAPPMAALPRDESRLQMMRRVKRMTLEERIELFDALSRDAAWARSASRLR